MLNKTKLIILGAGKPLTSESTGSLITEPVSERTVLDWQLGAASRIFDEIIYVAGYQFEVLTRKYPKLSITQNLDWENTGPLGSLQCVEFEDSTQYAIQYGDVVFMHYSEKSIDLKEDEILVFFDRNKKNKLTKKETVCFLEGIPMKFGYEIPVSNDSYELCGLIYVQGKYLKHILSLNKDENHCHSLSFLAEVQRILGGKLRCLPINSNWIEINNHQDFAKQVLGTKAETLQRLGNVLLNSFVLGQVTINYEKWISNPKITVESVLSNFPNKNLIIRSSALSEDGFKVLSQVCLRVFLM